MAQGAQDDRARARPLSIPVSVHAIFTISDFAGMRLLAPGGAQILVVCTCRFNEMQTSGQS
jgi:hypothetical protein